MPSRSRKRKSPSSSGRAKKRRKVSARIQPILFKSTKDELRTFLNIDHRFAIYSLADAFVKTTYEKLGPQDLKTKNIPFMRELLASYAFDPLFTVLREDGLRSGPVCTTVICESPRALLDPEIEVLVGKGLSALRLCASRADMLHAGWNPSCVVARMLDAGALRHLKHLTLYGIDEDVLRNVVRGVPGLEELRVKVYCTREMTSRWDARRSPSALPPTTFLDYPTGFRAPFEAGGRVIYKQGDDRPCPTLQATGATWPRPVRRILRMASPEVLDVTEGDGADLRRPLRASGYIPGEAAGRWVLNHS